MSGTVRGVAGAAAMAGSGMDGAPRRRGRTAGLAGAAAMAGLGGRWCRDVGTVCGRPEPRGVAVRQDRLPAAAQARPSVCRHSTVRGRRSGQSQRSLGTACIRGIAGAGLDIRPRVRGYRRGSQRIVAAAGGGVAVAVGAGTSDGLSGDGLSGTAAVWAWGTAGSVPAADSPMAGDCGGCSAGAEARLSN